MANTRVNGSQFLICSGDHIREQDHIQRIRLSICDLPDCMSLCHDLVRSHYPISTAHFLFYYSSRKHSGSDSNLFGILRICYFQQSLAPNEFRGLLPINESNDHSRGWHHSIYILRSHHAQKTDVCISIRGHRYYHCHVQRGGTPILGIDLCTLWGIIHLILSSLGQNTSTGFRVIPSAVVVLSGANLRGDGVCSYSAVRSYIHSQRTSV